MCEGENEQVGAPYVRAGGQYAREEGQESIGDVHVVCKGSVSADCYLFGGLKVDPARKARKKGQRKGSRAHRMPDGRRGLAYSRQCDRHQMSRSDMRAPD